MNAVAFFQSIDNNKKKIFQGDRMARWYRTMEKRSIGGCLCQYIFYEESPVDYPAQDWVLRPASRRSRSRSLYFLCLPAARTEFIGRYTDVTRASSQTSRVLTKQLQNTCLESSNGDTVATTRPGIMRTINEGVG
jgi:hypothetical protein